jgi:hypothetical protein
MFNKLDQAIAILEHAVQDKHEHKPFLIAGEIKEALSLLQDYKKGIINISIDSARVDKISRVGEFFMSIT